MVSVEWLRDDLASFFGVRKALKTGLHSYRFQTTEGKRQLHLRKERDGSGTLFVDAVDVIHLSEVALDMVWLALEGVASRSAMTWLGRRYQRVEPSELSRHWLHARELVQTLSSPSTTCPSCATALPQTPLFATRAQAPHKVDLAITYACNNECPHCYNDPQRFDLQSLSASDWIRVIDRLADQGVPHLIFTGGEATFHPDLPQIIAHAVARGQVTGLNSNGRRLKHQPYTAALKAAGLEHVQITLESHQPQIHNAMVADTRAFEQTVAGIECCLDEGIFTITNTTLTKLNRDTIEDTVDFLYQLGLRMFAMNGMIYSGGGTFNPDALLPSELPPLLLRVKNAAQRRGMRFLWYTVTEYCEMSPIELEIGAKRCNAGEYSMCVEPNGDVLPCQSYYVSAGNILRDDWDTIWKGELFRSFREREEDPKSAGLPQKCWECPDLEVCGGGCRIEREMRDGTASFSCSGCGDGGPRSSGASATTLIHAESLVRKTT